MKYEIVTFVNDEVKLDVNVSPDEDTVWLTLEQIGTLFERDRSVIGKHIKNIYKEQELDENSTRANFAHVQMEGEREITREVSFYNLDVIISVGYRVKSKNGVMFRKWANSVLKEYLFKGYVINENRTLITNENYINLINKVDSIDKRLSLVEKVNLYNNCICNCDNSL
ncbi:MAG: virulence RhuM family protein [Bacilli bacterium]|nr:virulence RhuM family protein [Bacilli bacterium]